MTALTCLGPCWLVMTSLGLQWLGESQAGPVLVVLAQGLVSVPLPEDLGWGGRGPLDSDPNAPWPPDSGLALLALLLESVLVSGEADLLGLEMAERPHEGSN